MKISWFVTRIMLVLSLLPLSLNAQITAKLHQPPPNQLKASDLWWVDLNNLTKETYTVYLHVIVYETKHGRVAEGNSNEFELPPGLKRIKAADIKAVNDFWYHEDYKNIIAKNGWFPAGEYEICVYVVEAKTKKELTKSCIQQEVSPKGPPRLIYPQDNTQLKEKYPLFTWMAPAPLQPGEKLLYSLRIVEVLEGQTPEQALKANIPWFEEKEIAGTSIRYPSSAQPLAENKIYAWQVAALGTGNIPTGESIIWDFRIPKSQLPFYELEPLSIWREVEQHCNYFTVTLTLHNNTRDEFRSISLRDQSRGLQCIGEFMVTTEGGPFGSPIGPSGQYLAFVAPATSEFRYQGWSLRPNEEKSIVYNLVPVLYDRDEPGIIGSFLTISYDAGGRRYSFNYPSKADTLDLAEINSAFVCADFLIVTCPEQLYNSYPGSRDSTNLLLSTIAELAKQKSGVLGYALPGWSANDVKATLQNRGAWSRRLASNWTTNGYLLLAGENNIVPSFDIPDIHITDYPYADLDGNQLPELKVGRIVGRTPTELMLPLRVSLNVAQGRARFDGFNALLVSAPEGPWDPYLKAVIDGSQRLRTIGASPSTVLAEYNTTEFVQLREALLIKGSAQGGSSHETPLDGYSREQLAAWLLDSEHRLPAPAPSDRTFTDTEGVRRRLPAGFGSTDIQNALRIAERTQAARPDRGGAHATYRYFPDECLAGQQIIRDFKSALPNKSVILYNGHGDPTGWCGVLYAGHPCAEFQPISFGSTPPVILCFACDCGNYTGTNSVVRDLMRNGVAAYLGSTEVSFGENDEATREGFWRHWSRTARIGDAVFDFKRRVVPLGGGWPYFAKEYNLYGDPKFGGR